MTNISIEKTGRRFYLIGNTYPVKDALRSAGAHWDRDRGAWWTSKADVAERFAAEATAKAEARSAAAAATAGESRVAIGGNTYPVRDQLRDMGGSWDAASKSWLVPASKADAARALVGSAPKRSFARRRGFGGCCRECRGPIVNAPHHRAMGGLCGSCAFDEYDC